MLPLPTNAAVCEKMNASRPMDRSNPEHDTIEDHKRLKEGMTTGDFYTELISATHVGIGIGTKLSNGKGSNLRVTDTADTSSASHMMKRCTC